MTWNNEEILTVIRTEVSKILTIDKQLLDDNTALVEYGLESIQAMDIVLTLEEQFRIEIDESEMHDIGSITEILLLIQKKITAE